MSHTCRQVQAQETAVAVAGRRDLGQTPIGLKLQTGSDVDHGDEHSDDAQVRTKDRKPAL